MLEADYYGRVWRGSKKKGNLLNMGSISTLDSGPWSLDSGPWTLDSVLLTLDSITIIDLEFVCICAHIMYLSNMHILFNEFEFVIDLALLLYLNELNRLNLEASSRLIWGSGARGWHPWNKETRNI